MPYHLRDHIYITQFRDQLILLDLKSDKYIIFSQESGNLLFCFLENRFSPLTPSEQDIPEIQSLIEDKILEKNESPFPFFIDRKVDSNGVSNIDWMLPLENKKAPLNFAVFKALITLLKVNFYIKIRGFYRTIRLIKKSLNNKRTYMIPSDKDLRDLANIVNKACLIYPTRTKCLEWAITFVLLALKRNWKCNLEIGVQNYPFMAHAWVECDSKVVMDSQDLREGLGIILNEPFRKLK